MVTPVACFAGGHRTTHNQDHPNLDIKFHILVLTVVAHIGGLDWSAPRHNFLSRMERTLIGMSLISSHHIMVPETPGTTLVERSCGVDDGTKGKYGKIKKHVGVGSRK